MTRVKLLRDGLYGTTQNWEAGQVVALDDGLARDVALRGDGLLVVESAGQEVPAYGAVAYPSIPASALDAEGEEEGKGDEPPKVPAVPEPAPAPDPAPAPTPVPAAPAPKAPARPTTNVVAK